MRRQAGLRDLLQYLTLVRRQLSLKTLWSSFWHISETLYVGYLWDTTLQNAYYSKLAWSCEKVRLIKTELR